jgi:ornithine decarboxylase
MATITHEYSQAGDFVEERVYRLVPGVSAGGNSHQKVEGQPLAELLNQLDHNTENAGTLPINNAFAPFLPTPPPGSPRTKATSDLGINEDALVPVHDADVDSLIRQKIMEAEQYADESAFFVGDLSNVYSAVQKWKNSPLGDRVEIFYAVKCNPSPVVLHLLSLMGTSFDCASVAEINTVLSLPNAPSPDRIIFANPCKPVSFIRAAANNGVEMMTFDNADELHKIARSHPGAKLVLRILTDDSKSLCRLGLKFGAPLSTCAGLLNLASNLGLNVIGVSFHVGSGCKDPLQFADAVWRAKQVFDMGKMEGYEFTFLDVGGGFEAVVFDEMSLVLRDALELYFPVKEGVRIVAEPGRFLVAPAFTLATNIIARRKALDEPPITQVQELKAEGEGADVMCKLNSLNPDSWFAY